MCDKSDECNKSNKQTQPHLDLGGGIGGQLKNRTKPQTWLNCTELSRPLTKLS